MARIFQSGVAQILVLIISCFVFPAVSNKVTLTFFRNGEHTHGVEYIARRSERIKSTIKRLKKKDATLFGVGLKEAYHIYNKIGKKVESFKDAPDDAYMWIVSENRYFIWPHFHAGYRVNVNLGSAAPNVTLESLSYRPRVFYLHNFMTEEEADSLIENALNIEDNGFKLTRSTTGTTFWADRDMTEDESYSSARTSQNAWDQTSPYSLSMMRRSFTLLGIPYHYQKADGLQILHYEPTQAYQIHLDWFDEGSYGDFNFNPQTGGANRYATIFVYLNDVEAGGQTIFPEANTLTEIEQAALSPEAHEALVPHNSTEEVEKIINKLFDSRFRWEPDMARKCHKGFSVRPKKATAVLFYSMDPTWALDQAAKHGACPILAGEKWGANIWVWNNPRFGFDEPAHSEL